MLFWVCVLLARGVAAGGGGGGEAAPATIFPTTIEPAPPWSTDFELWGGR